MKTTEPTKDELYFLTEEHIIEYWLTQFNLYSDTNYESTVIKQMVKRLNWVRNKLKEFASQPPVEEKKVDPCKICIYKDIAGYDPPCYTCVGSNNFEQSQPVSTKSAETFLKVKYLDDKWEPTFENIVKSMEEYASKRVADIVAGNIGLKMIDNVGDITKELKKRIGKSQPDNNKEVMPIVDQGSWFYKNCKRQRKLEAKICGCCPFREGIEKQELAAK